jgi:hypothetical protein
VLRAKTKEDNIERDDKIAREEDDNLAREKQSLAREQENLAREKMPARENLAREKMPARENLAREKMPARENKTIQNISTNATPVRAAASSQVLTSAYTLSARHDRSLGIITKSDSSLVAAKPEEHKAEGFKFNNEKKTHALTTWKNLLIETRDYMPFRVRSIRAYEASIKALIRAMRNYKEAKPAGNQCLQWTHDKHAPLQQEYWIPQTYCEPEVYFKNLEKDVQFAYYNRPCSVYEYYELVCNDTPGYDPAHVKGQHNRASFKSAARQPTTSASSTTSSASSTRPVAHNPGFQRSHDPPPEYDEDEALARWKKNPPAPEELELSSPAHGTTKYSEEQKWAADQTQIRRKKALIDQRAAPVPEDDDSTNDTEPDDNVFDEHLLPSDKLKIANLKKEHKLITTRVYSKSYKEARNRDITAAEQDRLKGGTGPLYLAGCKTPWSPGMGQAPQRYDDFQKDRLLMQIERIKKNNAELCQTHYTATKFKKGGPGGQVEL